MTKLIIIYTVLYFTNLVYNFELNEPVITKDYLEYLSQHSSFKITSYSQNIFKDWTYNDILQILDTKFLDHTPIELPTFEAPKNADSLPSSISWQNACSHFPRDQLECTSGWAFALAGMLSDACCNQGSDHGWLSPQELVSCDLKNHGCSNGWTSQSIYYINSYHGLVPESCFPYLSEDKECPFACQNGDNWNQAHVCDCMGGFKKCEGLLGIRACLTKGPITLAMGVCRSFLAYGGGIYLCDCHGKYMGIHTIEAVGYALTPVPHWIGKNSWGPKWGEEGYFKIACGECGIDGTYSNGNIMCEKVR